MKRTPPPTPQQLDRLVELQERDRPEQALATMLEFRSLWHAFLEAEAAKVGRPHCVRMVRMRPTVSRK
jgi:hypothetical protein